jgi:hypothetical protein
MNCKTARGLFSLRLDEGLSYDEQRRLTQHLDSCPRCLEEYRGVERTVGLLHDLPEIEASPTFLQDVLRAARNLHGEEASLARAPGIWERMRGRFSVGLLEPAPRWALAALTLGLIVGVSGSMMLFHRTPVPVSAERVETVSTPRATPVAAVPPAAVSPSEMPSGPFEDLVQEMLRRAESAPSGGADSSSTPNPEWGAGWDPSVHGQAVGYGPTVPTGRAREGSVSIVF